MKRCVFLCLALAGGLAFAAAALADDNCLTPRQVQSWNNLGPHALVVRATGGHRYRLDLAGKCLGIQDAITLAVSSRGTGTCVSEGDYISYTYHQMGEQRCMITAIAPYAPDAGQPQPQPSGY